MTGSFSARAPRLATELHESAASLPIIAPHGHVPVEVLAGSDDSWRDPARLFVTGDHYVVRMLYSLGAHPSDLGMARVDGADVPVAPPREVWRRLCEARRAFLTAPTGYWIEQSMRGVFGLDGWPAVDQADATYDAVAGELEKRSALDLLALQGVDYISTTDGAAADLSVHDGLRAQECGPRVAPTFRPDELDELDLQDWPARVAALASRADHAVVDFKSFLEALRIRRSQFQRAGATASDHGMRAPVARRCSASRAHELFERGLTGSADRADAAEFASHLINEHADMAADDGLVMQLHVGVHRDHHSRFVQRYGQATGSDIPFAVDFTGGMQEFMESFGARPGLRIVLFTLDESTYTRELAPLAGHYPAVRLGPPWWFLDSPRGIRRYLDAVVETAGLLNLAGFNDDTRNVATVAARHDLWRRSVAGWLADVVAEERLTESDAHWAMRHLSHDAALDTYRLSPTSSEKSEQEYSNG